MKSLAYLAGQYRTAVDALDRAAAAAEAAEVASQEAFRLRCDAFDGMMAARDALLKSVGAGKLA